MNSLFGFLLAYIVLFCVIGGGWFLQRRLQVPVVRTALRARFVRIFLIFLLIGVVALQVAISYSEYSMENGGFMSNNTSTNTVSSSSQGGSNFQGRGGEGERSPIGLAFADGCIIMFGALMYPAARYSFVMRWLRVSFERVVWLHTVAGIGMIALMIGHWIAMGANVSGLVIFVSSVMAAVPALLRQFSYKFFRLTHMLAVVALITVIAHAPRVLLMLFPSLLIWVVDIVHRWRWQASNPATHVVWKYSPTNTLVEMTLERPLTEASIAHPPKPGQFAALLIPDIDLIPHPISIAKYEKLLSTPTSGIPPQPGSYAAPSTSTTEGNVGTPTTERFTFFIRRTQEESWTGQLARLSQSGLTPLKPVRVAGIHGELGIPLERCSHLIFFAGGIGVTPWMHILDSLCQEHQQLRGLHNITTIGASPSNSVLQSVTFIWAGRHVDDVEAMGPMIVKSLNGLQLRRTTLKYFCTTAGSGPSGGVVAPSSSMDERYEEVQRDDIELRPLEETADTSIPRSYVSSPPPQNNGFSITFGARPDIRTELFTALSAVAALDTSSVTEKRIGVFVCGPAPFMASVVAECDSQSVLCHSEAFDM